MLKFLKNISIYSFGEILNKSIQFLLLPLYTYYLTPADYGKLELTYLYGGVLVIFYGFIIENGYARLYFDKNDTSFRDSLFGTSFFFKLSSGFIFLIISVIFAEELAYYLLKFENGDYYIILISISVYVKSLAEIPLKTLIIEKRAKRYIINNFIYLVVSLVSTICFIVFFDLKVIGVLYGQILGAAVQLITLLFSEWKWSFISFSVPLFKGMFNFSLFMIPTQLASFVTYWSNRLFLQEYTSLDDMGKFSFGYKIASVISILLTGPLKKAISPEVYELLDQPEESRKRIRQFTLITLLILTVSSLALSMFSKEMIEIMASEEYESSYQFVFILSMSYVIIGTAGIVVLPINISKKTWLITITWFLSSLVNILLNYVFVKYYGTTGACFATLFTFLFILVLYFIFAEFVYEVGFEYKKYILVIVIAFISYYLSTLLQHLNIVISILFKILILLLTIFSLFKAVMSKEDNIRVKGIVIGIFPRFSGFINKL